MKKIELPTLQKKKLFKRNRKGKCGRLPVYEVLPGSKFISYIIYKILKTYKTNRLVRIPREYYRPMIQMWIDAQAKNLLNGYSIIEKNSEIRLAEKVKFHGNPVMTVKRLDKLEESIKTLGPANRKVFIQMIRGKNFHLRQIRAAGTFGTRMYKAIVEENRVYKTEHIHEKICID